jgi:hypothetical protein
VARVEGAVSLADVRAPLFASVGLERTAFPDTRPLPEDIKPPVARSEDAFVYGYPRRYQYGAIFEYGAGLDLLRVVDGAINTSLTVPVGTVNRTWRKPLVDLKGVSGHFDLVKGAEGSAIRTRTVPGAGPLDRGSATTVVQGRTPIGLWESEVPLVNLASPSGNARYQRPQPNDTRAPVDLSKLERVFYDDLCRARPGEACHVDGTPFPFCQMYSTCKIQAAGGSGICETQCRGQEAPCKQSSDWVRVQLAAPLPGVPEGQGRMHAGRGLLRRSHLREEQTEVRPAADQGRRAGRPMMATLASKRIRAR